MTPLSPSDEPLPKGARELFDLVQMLKAQGLTKDQISAATKARAAKKNTGKIPSRANLGKPGPMPE